MKMDTLRRSRTPTTAVTANGEVQTNEEAQVYVHDLDLFVTVHLLEETPAGLSLGELCSEHGCSYEWKNDETPRSHFGSRFSVVFSFASLSDDVSWLAKDGLPSRLPQDTSQGSARAVAVVFFLVAVWAVACCEVREAPGSTEMSFLPSKKKNSTIDPKWEDNFLKNG